MLAEQYLTSTFQRFPRAAGPVVEPRNASIMLSKFTRASFALVPRSKYKSTKAGNGDTGKDSIIPLLEIAAMTERLVGVASLPSKLQT